jgi:flagellar biosynthesis chaperone FliJ
MNLDLRKQIKNQLESHLGRTHSNTEIDNLADDIFGVLDSYDRHIDELVQANIGNKLLEIRSNHERQMAEFTELRNKDMADLRFKLQGEIARLSHRNTPEIVKTMEKALGESKKELRKLRKIIRLLLGDE